MNRKKDDYLASEVYILLIDFIIKNKKYVDKNMIADRFKVSIRTADRWIKRLINISYHQHFFSLDFKELRWGRGTKFKIKLNSV